MADVQHVHDWTATNAGYMCTQCSASVTNLQIGAYIPTAAGQTNTDSQISIVWETVNGGP